MDKIPEWFWVVLEDANFDLGRLANWLQSASRTEIEDYQNAFEYAKEAVVVDHSAGIEIGGEFHSEDGTEDFCTWIVGQGRQVWQAALPSGGALSVWTDEYDRFERGQSVTGAWSDASLGDRYPGSRAPDALAYKIYPERFDADLYDAVDRYN